MQKENIWVKILVAIGSVVILGVFGWYGVKIYKNKNFINNNQNVNNPVATTTNTNFVASTTNNLNSDTIFKDKDFGFQITIPKDSGLELAGDSGIEPGPWITFYYTNSTTIYHVGIGAYTKTDFIEVKKECNDNTYKGPFSCGQETKEVNGYVYFLHDLNDNPNLDNTNDPVYKIFQSLKALTN